MHWIWRSIIIGTIVGLGVFTFIFYSETGLIPESETQGIALFVALVLFAVTGVVLHALSLKYNKILPWNTHITARFFVEVASGLLVLAAVGLAYTFLILNKVQLPEEEGTFWQVYWGGAVKFGIVSLVVLYIYAQVNFSIYSYNQYSVHQIDKLREEHNQLHLQFEALKTQLSPHFLFNALNTISSLIYKDIRLAEDFIRRLAQTYRYILKTNEQPLIRLSSELEMLKGFYFMQCIKFEDCIEFVDEIEAEHQNTWIPPLTLQMLMENALKHNLICEDKKLVMRLESNSEKQLVFQNNLIPKTQLLKIGNNLVDRPGNAVSHRIGLSNIRERYAFFSNRKIEVVKTNEFLVKLPIIEAHHGQKAIL